MSASSTSRITRTDHFNLAGPSARISLSGAGGLTFSLADHLPLLFVALLTSPTDPASDSSIIDQTDAAAGSR